MVDPKKTSAEGADALKQYKRAAVDGKIIEQLSSEAVGVLEADEGENTYDYKQEDIRQVVDVQTGQKMYSIKGDQGPYSVSFERTGNFFAMGGHLGHITIARWKDRKIVRQMHVGEQIRDIQFLHNRLLFAVAQKDFTFIYDDGGLEIHRLRSHTDPQRLQFLPYHMLLATLTGRGSVVYQDISTGELAAELRTKASAHGSPLAQNRWNAVLATGHQNGVVKMWAPSVNTPLMTIKSHGAGIGGLDFDRSGRYMVAAGIDTNNARPNQVKIFDLRRPEHPLHSYYTHDAVRGAQISDTGMLALTMRRRVVVYKDCLSTKAGSTYMTHLPQGNDLHGSAAWCPHEDFLGLGQVGGATFMVAPGSADPNFDSLEVNPYQTAKQRRESEVRGLLEKLRPDQIVLDPTSIGRLSKTPRDRHKGPEFRKVGPMSDVKLQRGRTRAAKRLTGKKKVRAETERAMASEAGGEKRRAPRKGDVLSRF